MKFDLVLHTSDWGNILKQDGHSQTCNMILLSNFGILQYTLGSDLILYIVIWTKSALKWSFALSQP